MTLELPELPSSADVVVIGAGAFGFATACQLARLGAGKVVLIDQYEPGTQVSPRAAGLFKMVQSSETVTRLAHLSRQIVTTFGQETGYPIPYQASGSLLVARTRAHASMLDADVEDSRGWGARIDLVDGVEAQRLCPWFVPDHALAIYHLLDDFYIEEPRSMLIGYRQAGEARGLQVIGHTPVTGIDRKDGAITGVQTTRGSIASPVVVDCAGVWSGWIGKLAGTFVPVMPMRHQLRITAPIEGVNSSNPIVRVVDASSYVRPARDGLMVGGFESDPTVIPAPEGTGFTVDMVPMGSQFVDQFVNRLENSIPVLAGATAQEERGGLFTMTADGRLLAGPVSGLRGFWVATGCNGSGFSLSSAVGRCLAEWIVGGEPPFDISLLAPDRFDKQQLTIQLLEDAATWQYANYYTPMQH